MKGILPIATIMLLAGFTGCRQRTQGGCHHTVTGDLRINTFRSAIYHREQTIRVWLPPNYDQTAASKVKYPVLYVLDGQLLFDECTAVIGPDSRREHEIRMDEIVSRLIASKRIPPIIIVGVDSSRQRNSEYAPYKDSVADPSMPAPIGKTLPAFLATEVIPYVSAHYRVSTDPRNVGIGGFSLAGAAALYTVLNRPDLFGLALLESPALWSGNGQLLRDTTYLVRGPYRIAIGVGTSELDEPEAVGFIAQLHNTSGEANVGFVRMSQIVASNLKAALLNHPDVLLKVETGGQHNREYWDHRLPGEIEFLYRP